MHCVRAQAGSDNEPWLEPPSIKNPGRDPVLLLCCYLLVTITLLIAIAIVSDRTEIALLAIASLKIVAELRLTIKLT